MPFVNFRLTFLVCFIYIYVCISYCIVYSRITSFIIVYSRITSFIRLIIFVLLYSSTYKVLMFFLLFYIIRIKVKQCYAMFETAQKTCPRPTYRLAEETDITLSSKVEYIPNGK